jgi:signal transduction histidine kinase/ligand-binding sensor domain-containing protein/DNA-binding response OmpR family regulator
MFILQNHVKLTIACFSLFLAPVFQLDAQNTDLKFDHLTVNNGLPQNSVYSIVKDKYGFMWFGTWGGAVRFDGYTTKVFRASDSDTIALSDNRIKAIITDSLKNIWIETGNPQYLYRYNYEYENFTRYLHDQTPKDVIKLLERWSNFNSEIFLQNKKYTFYSDHYGFSQIDRLTGQKKIYLNNENSTFSLSDNRVNSIYLDDNEELWIGTQNGGVNHANLNPKPFKYYYAVKNGKGLINNIVRVVCKDKKGRLWVGSENQGITIIEPFKNDNKFIYLGKETFQNLEIRSIYCDSQGFVWIGNKQGLTCFNPYTNSFKHCSTSICDQNVFAIFEDHQGTLWVGTLNGLARYDKVKDLFECFDPATTTGGAQIRAIIEDRHNNLWIATEDAGLTKLIITSLPNQPIKFKSFRYIHLEGNENSIINNRAYSLSEDKDGMIWIATNSGLSRLNPMNNSFKHFTIKNGLPDDITMGVLFDGIESVWVSHKKGLTRVNIHTFEIQNFNMFDGLQGLEFNQNACYRDDNTGELFFGGSNGLNSFFSKQITINQYKPRVVFTQLSVMQQMVRPGIKINNHVILEKSLLCTSDITLNWWDKNFRIEFTALNFANPLENKYKYKLEGFDKHWVFTDASMRFASYPNLPSGTYTFKVFASNSDGVWSEFPATLRIKVLPPWWLAWWAIIIYMAFGWLVVWFIFKDIASRLELRKNKEIHSAKLHFFTEVSHEFRTPLTLIIDPAEKLLTENLDKDTINNYHNLIFRNAKQLLLLINQLLDFRKLEAGHLSLNLQQSDIVVFLRTAVASFEAYALEHNIQFVLKTEVNQWYAIFDVAKFNMVLNNLLSNAFKFTPDFGEISILLDVSRKDELVIQVCDTGIGIPKDELEKVFGVFYQSANTSANAKGSGIGLALTKELVQLHGGKLLVESEVGKGSCFSVILPNPKLNGIAVSETFFESSFNPAEISTERSFSNTEKSPDLPLMLVVDDNVDIRDYIDLNFNKFYRIELASNGTEGFQKATESIPDIVISDVMMPGLNGLELCRLLKSDERTSHIPVVLLTARQSDESKTEGYETGADAYVTKPFNSTVLRAQVQNLLEQRQRLRELFTRGTDIELKKIAINITDEAFLKKVSNLIIENIDDENFEIDLLFEKLKMSRSQTYRKIKALTNKSLHDFVTTIRMTKALEYLLSGEYNISEVAYKVGFSQPGNFTRTFIKQFGANPTQYIESLKKQ